MRNDNAPHALELTNESPDQSIRFHRPEIWAAVALLARQSI